MCHPGQLPETAVKRPVRGVVNGFDDEGDGGESSA